MGSPLLEEYTMNFRFSLPVIVPALALSLCTTAVRADDNSVAGAIIGGAAGAMLGHNINGRTGAAVGGIIGAATGAAIASQHPYQGQARPVPQDNARDTYIYGDEEDDNGGVVYRDRVVYGPPVVQERVIYQQAPTVVYRPAPVVVYRDPAVVYRPAREVVSYGYPYPGWQGRGWQRRDDHDYHRYGNGYGYGHRHHDDDDDD